MNSRDLRFDYTRFLLKSLSPIESVYMKRLHGNLDNILTTSLDWIKTNKDILYEYDSKEDWLDDYYDDSFLEKIMVSLLGELEFNSLKPVSTFYRTGADLAYNHLGKNRVFKDSDEKALSNLEEYVGSVIDSINGEYVTGIVDTIGDNIDKDDNFNTLGVDLLSLSGEPIDNKFPVTTRCLFTAKTEYARSVNTGLLQAYSNYGVDNYDWITTGLPNVCSRCLEIESEGPYTLHEIMDLIPVHINCSCSVKGRLHSNHSLSRNPVVVDLTPKG